MEGVDFVPIRLGTSPPRENARQRFHKRTGTGAAKPSSTMNLQPSGFGEHFKVAHRAQVPSFASQLKAAAMLASHPSLQRPKVQMQMLTSFNLLEKPIAADNERFIHFGHTGILSPLSPFFDEEPVITL
jgi:hypothetical protein